MRTIAIGDIHGCRRALSELLVAIDPQPDDLIITLGDYVDRGPDSAGVIECLLGLQNQCKLIPLRGNHEEMMLDAPRSPAELQLWLNLGGKAALQSYSHDGCGSDLADIPESHWIFLQHQCLDSWETAHHIFVHGGVLPHVELSQQPPEVLRWQSFPTGVPHRSGKTVICGHTQQRDYLPRSVGHSICIDTGSGSGGPLTALEIETNVFWQANEQGFLGMSALAAPKRRY